MRILLVSHETTRSGAPRVALLVARALQAAGHDLRLLVRAPGPLLPEFEFTAPTSVERLRKARARLWRWSATSWAAPTVDTLLAAVSILLARPDLVYLNSASNAVYLRAARWLRRPVVLHVHESGVVAAEMLARAAGRESDPGVTVVACSPSVRLEIAALLGRHAAAVPLVPSVPDDEEVLRRSRERPDRPYGDELVVGCCGSVEPRKGADLWVAAARLALEGRREGSVRFVWVGDPVSPVDGAVPEGVDFVGPSPNPYAHMRRFDVATLPSRDDPFPLVVLESMLVGTPVVAFDVGGVREQIGPAGRLVPAGDVEGLARAISELLDDAAERSRLGSLAEERVRTTFSTAAFGALVQGLVGRAVARP